MDGGDRWRIAMGFAPVVYQVQQHRGVQAATETHIPVPGVQRTDELAIQLAMVQLTVARRRFRHGQVVGALITIGHQALVTLGQEIFQGQLLHGVQLGKDMGLDTLGHLVHIAVGAAQGFLNSGIDNAQVLQD